MLPSAGLGADVAHVYSLRRAVLTIANENIPPLVRVTRHEVRRNAKEGSKASVSGQGGLGGVAVSLASTRRDVYALGRAGQPITNEYVTEAIRVSLCGGLAMIAG